jgi:hypothetical protein
MKKPTPTFKEAMNSAMQVSILIMQEFPDSPSQEVITLAMKFATYRTAIEIIADQETIEKACNIEKIIYEMCVRNIQSP